MYLSNPKPERTAARRGGEVYGGAAGQGGVEQDGKPTGLFAKKRTDPFSQQGIDDNCRERFFGSTKKRNPM